MELYIYTHQGLFSIEELKEKIETDPSIQEADITFRLWKPPIQVRGMDPTVLIAIVGTVGTVFGALLTGLLQVAQYASAKKIVIQSKNGSRLEFPANLKPEEIGILVEKARDLDVQKIIIS